MRIATQVPETIVEQATEENDYSLKRSPEEAELEEGELAELPEELCEDLEAAAWSVGLDGLNVGY